MKKYKIIILVCIFTLLGIFTCRVSKTSNVYEENENNQIKKHVDTISMMLETEAGSGNYEMTTRDSWPTEGYVFNSTLSKCENGGELSWDDTNKKVLMSGNTSDKCYVYFDVELKTLVDYVKSLYTGTQGDNNIYYHDSSLENGAGDNSYRYAGSSETTNNYLCFGSTDETCPEDNLYRIIGVFDEQVKLIKNTEATSNLLGTDGGYVSDNLYRWSTLTECPSDTTAHIEDNTIMRLANKNIIAIPDFDGCNKWKYSQLNTTNLNTNYLNNMGAVWSNVIDDTTWKVGGNTWNNISATTINQIYQNEINNPATNAIYSAKIGLMYVSDYGYAAAPSVWTTKLNSYNNSLVTTANWMYMGLYEWTMTPDSSYSNYVFNVNSDGGVSSGSTPQVYSARPVFYLKTSVVYNGGSGTASVPIRIEI